MIKLSNLKLRSKFENAKTIFDGKIKFIKYRHGQSALD